MTASHEPRAQLALREWEDRRSTEHLSAEGRRAATRIPQLDSRLELTELREGLRIRTRSWVGVVRLDDLEIRITPKLAGDHLALAQLLEQTTGIDSLAPLAAEARIDLKGASLLDLVGLLFARACHRVLQRGLLAGYVEREELLPCVRGRILPNRQMLEHFGQLDRIACRFDELEHDVAENRILAFTLRCTHPRVEHPGVRRRLAALRAVFEAICDPQALDRAAVRAPLHYNRLNAHYREAHELAHIILKGLGVDDLLAPGAARSSAFLLDMNGLFERFATQLVERALPAPYRVRAQASDSSIIRDAATDRPYARVIPDLLVELPGAPTAALAIDAKYKLYDERPLDPDDVYQTFLYAYAFGSRPEPSPPLSLILYPASTATPRASHLRVHSLQRGRAAEIRAFGIAIPRALAELRAPAGRTPVIDALRTALLDLLPPATSHGRGAPEQCAAGADRY